MQKNYICYQRKSRETRCKPICLHHCFITFTEATNKYICLCYTHGLLQGQIYPLTPNLYYYQINKFKCMISNLLSVQIWPSSPNSHTYQIQKFSCIFLIFTIGQNIRWNPVNAHICYRYKYGHLHQIRRYHIRKFACITLMITIPAKYTVEPR